MQQGIKKILAYNRITVGIGAVLIVASIFVTRPQMGENPSLINLLFPLIASMYIASILLCGIAVGVCQLAKVDIAGISFGNLMVSPLYYRANTQVCAGIMPLPDIVISDFTSISKLRQWLISIVPSLAMIGLSGLFAMLRHKAFLSMTMVSDLNIPLYTVWAIMSMACLTVGIVFEILYIHKMAWIYPKKSVGYYAVMSVILLGIYFFVHSYGNDIVSFIYEPIL